MSWLFGVMQSTAMSGYGVPVLAGIMGISAGALACWLIYKIVRQIEEEEENNGDSTH